MANSENRDNASEWMIWLANLRTNWRTIAAFVFVFASVGIFVAMWTRSVYEAHATVKVESKMGGLTSMLGNFSGLLSSEGSAETEIEMAKSQRVIENAIVATGLQNIATPISPFNRFLHREGRLDLQTLFLPDTSVLPPKRRGVPWIVVVKDSLSFALLDDMEKTVISEGKCKKLYSLPYAGDSVKIMVSRISSHKGERFAVSHLDLRKAADDFILLLNVTERGKSTGIIELSYVDQYPDRAKNIVNNMTDAYLRQNVEFSNSDAQRTLAFLESQVPDVKRKLDSVENLLNSYRKQVGSVDIGAETQIALESQVQLQRQILQLQQDRQEKIRLFSVSHPAVQALDAQLADLQKELNTVGSRTRALPAKQQGTMDLMREVEFEQTLYTELLQRIEQLRLVAVGDAGTARIVDYAEVPLQPIKPKRKFIVLIAMILGFCASVAYISVRQKIQGCVKSVYLIEKKIGASVYACIPTIALKKKNHKAAMLVSDTECSEAVESLCTLHATINLAFAADEASHVISVVGQQPKVGKSFIASNLSVLFAKDGKKTVIIDANFHKGALASIFKSPRSEGLSEFLLGRISVDAALQETNIPNLSVLVAGKYLASPIELLSSAKFADLLKQMRSRFDIIIVDTPPLSLMVDALFVSRCADLALMVSEYNQGSLDTIRDSLNLLMKGNASLRRAVVLNKYKNGKMEYSHV